MCRGCFTSQIPGLNSASVLLFNFFKKAEWCSDLSLQNFNCTSEDDTLRSEEGVIYEPRNSP